MARLLVQLKLRLLTNALRSSGQAQASFIISTAFAALVAAGTFAVLALLRGQSGSVAATAAVFTTFAFGWLILPLLTFGLDGTLDPATLALCPLRTRPLAAGLLAASATGAWPLANVIGLLGVTVGLAHGVAGELVALLAVVLQVLFCIALARLVTTAMAGLLRSRRGADFAAFLIIPIFVLYEAFVQVAPKLAAEGKITAQEFAGVDTWLRWLPPDLAAHAIQDASAGRPGAALLRLAALVAIIAAVGALWIRLLGRAMVSVDTSTQSSAVRGAPLPFAHSGVRGAVAGRYLLYQRREPASIVRWSINAVVMGAVSVSSIRTPHHHVALILSAVFGGGMLGMLHSNSIGMTGPGFGLETTAPARPRALRGYFAGRNLALALVAAPLIVVVTFAIAAIAGHPQDAWWAAAVDFAAIGAGLGVSSVFTAILAYPMERRVGSPLPRAADGYTGQSVASSLGSLLGVGIAAAPLIVAVELTTSAPAVVRAPALLACGAAYGAALAWAGARIAAHLAAQRLPELSQIAARARL